MSWFLPVLHWEIKDSSEEEEAPAGGGGAAAAMATAANLKRFTALWDIQVAMRVSICSRLETKIQMCIFCMYVFNFQGRQELVIIIQLVT